MCYCNFYGKVSNFTLINLNYIFIFSVPNKAFKDSQATVVVYFSGHGWLNESTNRYYLLQHDVEPFDLPSSALDAQIFTDALRQITAKRLLVVIALALWNKLAESTDDLNKEIQSMLKVMTNAMNEKVSFLGDQAIWQKLNLPKIN